MTPEQIVKFIKEEPASSGVRLLTTLFEAYFTKQSVIDAPAVHPLDTVKHTEPDRLPEFRVVKRVKPSEDPADQGRSYNILVPREGTGRPQIDGRDATPDEIAEATARMNKDAAEQLKQMRDGTYKWLDRNVAPDKTYPTFPKGDGSPEDAA